MTRRVMALQCHIIFGRVARRGPSMRPFHRKAAMNVLRNTLILILFLPLLAMGCAGETDSSETFGPFRFVVVSDTHVELSNENDPNLRFIAAGQLFSGLQPMPDFVVNTGDLVQDLFCIPEVTCENPLEIITTYRDLVDTWYAMPMYHVIGNHDMRYFDTFVDQETPHSQWEYVFGGSPKFPSPYYSFTHNGFLFVMLNATDLAFDHESNDTPTFGDEQLLWLDNELGRGLPSLLFWHHYIHPPQSSDDPHNPVLPVIASHSDNVKGVFMGHGHTFMREYFEGIPFYETDALGRSDRPVYHLVECNPADGSISIVNEADISYDNGND